MKRSFLKNNYLILLLTILAITGLIIVENTMTFVKQDYFDEKIKAAELTTEALKCLKDYRMKNVLFVDDLNDPNETGIIGQKYSHITTENSSLPLKLSVTNPNVAALIVQFLKEADINEGDRIAVFFSGSFPALNIASLSAFQVLKVEPVIFMSITSSSWGANDPEFTFPDMVRILKDNNFFKEFDFQYASIGGLEDMGMSLSKKGIDLIMKSAERNNLTIINKGSLELNIQERVNIINQYDHEKPVKAFFNVGGGITAFGTSKNAEKIPSGLSKKLKLIKIPDKSGVIYEMAKRNIPIINLENFENTLKQYDLPVNPVPLPEIGKGELFYIYKYNIKIVLGVTLVLIIFITLLQVLEKRKNKLGNDIISEEIQI